MNTLNHQISGWGLTPESSTNYSYPKTEEFQNNLFTSSSNLIPRGLGRSYGDAAQISGGTTIDTRQLNGLNFDSNTGILSAMAGVSIDSIIREFAPQGWFVPVTPGTRFVTLGGAVASDVHGKNHHKSGSFSEHVTELQILTPAGLFTCSKELLPDLFYATCGGMGLTGIILSIKLKLTKILSTKMRVNTYRLKNLEDTFVKLSELDNSFSYTVAWIDTLSGGKNLGRSLVSAGEHADVADLKKDNTQWEYRASTKINFPIKNRINFINQMTAKVFNEVWYYKNKRITLDEIQSISKFFHPLDAINNWNYVYGKKGFVQYQFVVPDSEINFIREFVETLSKLKIPVFLAVLKKFGPENPAFLSFPQPGWTLAVDIPSGFPGLSKLLDKFDEKLISGGGRVYLTKDSRLKPEFLEIMYPKLNLFREIKSKYDPNYIVKSDLAIRLNI